MPYIAENLERILGMHALPAKDAALVLGVDKSTISHWVNGKRQPQLGAALRIREVFEVEPTDLVTKPFADLLAGPLGDVERFKRVEKRLKRTHLKVAS